jgi:hypothetical protein
VEQWGIKGYKLPTYNPNKPKTLKWIKEQKINNFIEAEIKNKKHMPPPN